ncbi:hypothetical protein C5E13_10060 [Pseudoclavibacter sp. RFBI4]|nr:hypothetical protein C5E13_10060 [Pseudoclavibacter sp. RFBI4]
MPHTLGELQAQVSGPARATDLTGPARATDVMRPARATVLTRPARATSVMRHRGTLNDFPILSQLADPRAPAWRGFASGVTFAAH